MEIKFEDSPQSNSEYMVDNKKYKVISHYTGTKDLDKVLKEIALRRAYEETKKPTV